MNDPEVTTLDTLPSNGLIAHTTALEAAGLVLALVRRVPAPFRSLADQVIRSASSVPANLSEGHG
jgi:four helix bundle protein